MSRQRPGVAVQAVGEMVFFERCGKFLSRHREAREAFKDRGRERRQERERFVGNR
jgi:hypothetical protein